VRRGAARPTSSDPNTGGTHGPLRCPDTKRRVDDDLIGCGQQFEDTEPTDEHDWVSFTVSGAPSGVSASMSPSSLVLGPSSSASSTLNIAVPAAYVTPLSFTLTVNACGAGCAMPPTSPWW
jgi:hypothetical protein